MPISIGTQFNSYLIGASIGVGGMGEVYRATDTKLKRDVAIKVLPADFAADANRLARFQREAEMLASLIITLNWLQELERLVPVE